MGNKTTARYAAVMRVNVPDAPAHVYLVERSDGVIKVAREALGGSKRVGPMLWPEKPIDAAQRHLLACLNDSKPERLTPDQLLLILRTARQHGHHAAIEFICRDAGYTTPSPVEPMDEMAELQRQFIESQRAMTTLLQRMERLQPELRRVA